ncbi:MAG: flavin reductase [Bryobacterales bacterium]|nr:flavin reductase [Bryobacterales bacterium]
MEHTTNAQPVFDTRGFRHALGRFASGITVLTVHHDGRPHGMTVNSFVSVSLDPPLILVSLDNRSFMHRVLPGVGRFGISVLAQNQDALSNHFAGRIAPDLHIRFISRDGVPLLEGAAAYFIARVEDAHRAGDHTLYISRVEHFEWNDERPLLFYGGQYRHIAGEKGQPVPYAQDDYSLFSIGSFDPPVR